MPDLFVLPPKQKLKNVVDNDIVTRVGIMQELIMDRERERVYLPSTYT